MHRRDLLKWSTLGAGAAGLPWLLSGQGARAADPPPPAAGKNLPPLKITDVKAVLTAPARIRP